MLRCFLLSLFLAGGVIAQVPLGATKKEVIDRLGWPQSTSGSEDREILNYPDYSVLLANGRVEKLQFKPKDGRLPNSYTPPASKTTPRAERQPRTRPPAETPVPKLDRVDNRPVLVDETSKPLPAQTPPVTVTPRPAVIAARPSTVAPVTSAGRVAQYVTKNAAPRGVYESKLSGAFKKSRISNLFKGSGEHTTTEAMASSAPVAAAGIRKLSSSCPPATLCG